MSKIHTHTLIILALADSHVALTSKHSSFIKLKMTFNFQAKQRNEIIEKL